MQCQAKAKSTQEQCRRRAVEGKRVCTVHGGLTPGGIASPHFKTGRHSRFLPDRLSGRYLDAVNDPELLNLRSDIALVDARIAELLSSLDAGESGRLWVSLNDSKAEFIAAQRALQMTQEGTPQRAQAQADMAVSMQEILGLIGRGAADWERWKEIADFLERRRRLVESEQKRLVAMQQMVTAEQAMTLVAALAASVREAVLEHVDADTGRAILARVQTDLVRLTADRTRGEADG